MKIAIVTGLCVEHDAISTVVAHELSVLSAAGHETMVFAHAVDRLDPDEFRIVHSPWLLAQEPFYEDADLIIFHFGIRYGLFDALLLPSRKARRVVRFHNVTPPELLVGSERWVALQSLEQIAIADRADAAWCDSKHNRDVLLEYSDLAPERAIVLPIHVPMTERGLRHRADHLGVRIQTVGRLVRAKGLMDLVEAYGLLPAQLRCETRIDIIGSLSHSDKEFIRQLRERAVVLGVAQQIHFHHDISDEHLHQSYADADIVVSASHHEGLCLPIVEGLANGCEVIVTDAGALPDTVGGHGTIVPAASPARLAEALTQAIDVVRTSTWRSEKTSRLLARAAHLRQFGEESATRRLLEEVGRVRNMTSDYAVTTTTRDRTVFLDRHRRLLASLVCPVCRSPLSTLQEVHAAGALVHGYLECPNHGRCGVVDSFKVGFLDRNLSRVRRGDKLVTQELDLLRDVRTDGHWNLIREGLLAVRESDSISFDSGSGGFGLRCLGGPCSGALEISWSGAVPLVLDLFRDSSEEVRYECEEPFPPTTEVKMRLLPSLSGRSRGIQALLGAVNQFVAPSEVRVPELGPCNRGNPYPARFSELLADLGPDAFVLDCGGGDRRFGDPRVINLEYLDYSLPDLYGDGLNLPFADASFDLVMSQAVLEHVPDPQRAVDEMERVLRPGGLLWVEAAFMQPLHAVPFDFMNISPHGIHHLCRSLEIIEEGSFGGLAGTLEWIGGLVDATTRLGADRFSTVLKTLSDLDAGLTDEESRQFASAEFVLGRKSLPLEELSR